jgi:Asp-tRNA(Asn)/Glu-tRNA(Gln) amidotransferase A subunit family amidase
MTEDALHYRPLLEVAGRIRSGELSPVALTETMLRRIERIDPKLHSYALVTADLALDQARQAEDEIVAGRADRGQGPVLHQGHPHCLRHDDPGRLEA